MACIWFYLISWNATAKFMIDEDGNMNFMEETYTPDMKKIWYMPSDWINTD
jgi:hypothetical protein